MRGSGTLNRMTCNRWGVEACGKTKVRFLRKGLKGMVQDNVFYGALKKEQYAKKSLLCTMLQPNGQA